MTFMPLNHSLAATAKSKKNSNIIAAEHKQKGKGVGDTKYGTATFDSSPVFLQCFAGTCLTELKHV